VTAGLAGPFALPSTDICVSASVGVAYAGGGANLPEQVLIDDDAAMYEVNRDGGARFGVADAGTDHTDSAFEREGTVHAVVSLFERGLPLLDLLRAKLRAATLEKKPLVQPRRETYLADWTRRAPPRWSCASSGGRPVHPSTSRCM
jgi:hypothetical protein